MALGPMVVSLKLKDELSAALRTATSAVSHVATGMTTAFRGVASQVFSLQNAILGIATGAAMKSLLHSFVDSEKRAFLFEQTLRNTGRYTPEFTAAMQNLAGVMQSVGTVSDEAVIETAQFLALSGRLATGEIPRATRAVADLAAATGGDMVTAARQLLQAIENDGAGLGRLRLGLDETAFKGKSVAEMLTVLEAKFGGMDEKLGQTTAGGIARAANAFDDLREKLGAFVADVLNSGPLKFLQVFFEELWRDLAGMNATFGKSGDAQKWGVIVVGAMKGVAVVIAAVVDGVRLMGKSFLDVMSVIPGMETPLEKAEQRARDLSFALDGPVQRLKVFAQTSADAKIASQFQLGALSVADFNAALAAARPIQVGIIKEAQEIALKLDAARATAATLKDAFGADGGQMRTAMEAIMAAIAGAEARMKALGEAGAEAGQKALAGAQAQAGAAGDEAGTPLNPMKLSDADIAEAKESHEKMRSAVDATWQMYLDATARYRAAEIRGWNESLAIVPQLANQYRQSTMLAAAGVPGMEAQALAVKNWSDAMKDLGVTGEDTGTALAKAAKKAGDGWKKSRDDAALDGWEDFFGALQDMANKSATVIADVSKMALEGVNTFVDKFVDGIFDGTIRNMRDVQRVAKEVLQDIAKEATKMAIKALIGSAVQAGATAVLGARGGMWEGGNGFAPLPRYAAGGIASEPALIAGEAGREAIVPLPGAGRSIPVTFTNEDGGGGGNVNVFVSIHALDGADVKSVLMSDEGQAALETGIVSRAARSLRFRDTLGRR